MGRKKSMKYYDEETGEVVEAGQSGEAAVMDSLLQSFVNTYTPCDDESQADEVFTMGRLREYLQAFTMPGTPDALPHYLSELKKQGYTVATSYGGDPAIFVCYNLNT